MFCVSLPMASYAACTQMDAIQKMSDVSDVLTPKMSTNADAASKLMSEMGDVMGTGTVTEATCTKLDDIKTRAQKL
jgi:hypothetical protein